MGCAPPRPLVLLGLGEVAGPLSLFPPRGILVQLGLGGGVLLPLGVGFPPPPILVGIGFAEGEKREGGRPPLLVLIGLGEGGGAQPI